MMTQGNFVGVVVSTELGSHPGGSEAEGHLVDSSDKASERSGRGLLPAGLPSRMTAGSL
jgi:hypothetical protein